MKRSILCTLAFSLFWVCGCGKGANEAFEKGKACLDKKDFDAAITAFTEAIRLDPKATNYYDRGWSYGKKGDYDKAIGDDTEAIRLNPKFALAEKRRSLLLPRHCLRKEGRQGQSGRGFRPGQETRL